MAYLFLFLLMFLAIFIIILVLIQRGRGGGLAGAFGGLGGQSAFGTKAGDTFTRITIGVVAVWILLCLVAVRYFRGSDRSLLELEDSPGVSAPADTEGGEDATDGRSAAPDNSQGGASGESTDGE